MYLLLATGLSKLRFAGIKQFARMTGQLERIKPSRAKPWESELVQPQALMCASLRAGGEGCGLFPSSQY